MSGCRHRPACGAFSPENHHPRNRQNRSRPETRCYPLFLSGVFRRMGGKPRLWVTTHDGAETAVRIDFSRFRPSSRSPPSACMESGYAGMPAVCELPYRRMKACSTSPLTSDALGSAPIMRMIPSAVPMSPPSHARIPSGSVLFGWMPSVM